MIGTCKLCLIPGLELRGSHYIPKAVYRQLRDVTSSNPNPWSIDKATSVQTSRQLIAPLLCETCEGRFSKFGEDWVLRHFLKADGGFRLASILAVHKPTVYADGNATRVYLAGDIPEIDVASLTYFAASMFWRGSIHPWNDDGSVPVPLGPYAEPFRRYLQGDQEFPEDVALLLTVREGDEVSRLTATPVGKRQGSFRVYKFPMPGLAFAIAVGRGISDQARRFCFVHGVGHPIAVTPLLEEIVQQDAIRYLQGHASRRAAR